MSPFEGLVVRSHIMLNTPPDVRYRHSWGGEEREFMVLRVRRRNVTEGKPFEPVEIPGAYAGLVEFIRASVEGTSLSAALLNLAFDSGFRKLNRKGMFRSKGDLLEAAEALVHVHAVWLPDWDFTTSTGYFG